MGWDVDVRTSSRHKRIGIVGIARVVNAGIRTRRAIGEGQIGNHQTIGHVSM